MYDQSFDEIREVFQDLPFFSISAFTGTFFQLQHDHKKRHFSFLKFLMLFLF